MPPPRLSTAARQLLACLSFFNLALAPLWAASRLDYLEPLPYAQLLALVALAGTLLFAAVRLLQGRADSRAAQLAAIALFLLLPAEGLRQALDIRPLALLAPLPSWLLATGLLVLVGGFAVVVWRHAQRLVQAGSAVLLLMSPLLAYSAYLALSRGGEVGARYVHHERATDGPEATRTVYLLLADEADYALIYGARADRPPLPAFDRLAATSLSYTQAYSAGHDTVLSVPALLLGRELAAVSLHGQALAVRTREGARIADWRSGDQLLAQATATGLRVAALGYFHPYCNPPAPPLSYCSHWRVFPFRRWAFDVMPLPLAALQENAFARRLLPRYFPAAVERAGAEHAAAFAEASAELLQLPPRFELVYAHLDLPHPVPLPIPALQAHLGRVTRADYDAHLVRLDAFLGRWLAQLEASGRESVVILSSDHGLRIGSWRAFGYDVSDFDIVQRPGPQPDLHVPLLVHFSVSRRPLVVDAPTGTVALAPLAMALARGTVRDERQAADLIAAQPYRLPESMPTSPFEP